MKNPRICMFDFITSDVESVEKIGFNVTQATLGSIGKIVRESNERVKYNPDYSFPKNLHEFEIVIFSLDKPDQKSLIHNLYFKQKESGSSKVSYLISDLPQTRIDHRQLCMHMLNNELSDNCIIILFASADESQFYKICDNDGDKTTISSNTFNLLSILPRQITRKNVCGDEIVNINEDDDRIFDDLLDKNVSKFTYEVVFDYIGRSDVVESSGVLFVPLLKNKSGAVVSFLLKKNNNTFIVLPRIDNKIDILLPLLTDYLPEFYPNIFPEISKFSWKDTDDYLLPSQNRLITLKKSVINQYQERMLELDRQIIDQREGCSFLYDMISETGEKLVNAVKIFFEWLGFTCVKNMDYEMNEEQKQEDLQIHTDNVLFVIEVKGIGGTSKDKECSQVSKFRRRREKKLKGKKAVVAIYLVNHQRYLPPLTRVNPPFTTAQINDAFDDERGLLTTWQLFEQYILIENGIATKEQTRKQLEVTGLIDLFPKDLQQICILSETFPKSNAIIIELNNNEINLGDTLYAFKGSNFFTFKVMNMRVNDTDVDKANSGQVGVKCDKLPQKGSIIYKRCV